MNKTKHEKKKKEAGTKCKRRAWSDWSSHILRRSAFGRWGNSCRLDLHTICLAPVAVASPDSWFW